MQPSLTDFHCAGLAYYAWDGDSNQFCMTFKVHCDLSSMLGKSVMLCNTVNQVVINTLTVRCQ